MGKAVNETVWIDRDGVVWMETGDGRLRRDGVRGAVIVDPGSPLRPVWSAPQEDNPQWTHRPTVAIPHEGEEQLAKGTAA